jgi:CheY-like chemotaxis protein/tetratricopeptide (TPR) repeat protein
MSPRVLIAEDDTPFATVLETLLRRQGLDTERAADGAATLQSLAASPPDLLLLDLQLPRLHGMEVLKKIRQSPRTRHLPVAIITGVYRGEGYARAAAGLGVQVYLEKPFRSEALLAAIRPLLTQTTGMAMDRHLRRALLARFTGCYLLAGEKQHALYFADGWPIALQPGLVHADLGDFLRRRGAISAGEYDWYRQQGEGRPETLVQLGCLDYGGLLREMLDFLREELVAGFARPFRLVQERPLPLPGMRPLAVNLPQVFLQGYQRHLDPPQGRQFLAAHGMDYVAPSGEWHRFVNLLSLNAEEKMALARLDGSRTLQEILQGAEGLVPLLCTLQSLGMIRLASEPLPAVSPGTMPLRTLFNAVQEDLPLPAEEVLERFEDLVAQAGETELPAAAAVLPGGAAAPPIGEKVRAASAALKGKNHYEIFGLAPGRFSFDRLKERYFAMTREYGPDVLMQLSGEEAAVVEEILSAVATAYNTLSDVVKKERYDELLGSEKIGLGQKGDDRFQAQVQFQSGKVFLEMEDWDAAEKALQDACNIAPDNGDFLAHLAWSLYRNPRNVSSRAMLEKAKQTLNRALVLERSAPGFAFKGWMLLEAGQDALAESEFNKALKLDARQSLARKGLRTLQEKQEQQKKSLFGRMFK